MSTLVFGTHSQASAALRDDLPPDVFAAQAVPSQDIGKFVNIKRLGQGGMGEVWKAWEKELRRYVARNLRNHGRRAAGLFARHRAHAERAHLLQQPRHGAHGQARP